MVSNVDRLTKFIKKRPLGVLFLLYGIFYVFLPHEIHTQISPDWILGFGFPHEFHILLGIGWLFLASREFGKKKRRKKRGRGFYG